MSLWELHEREKEQHELEEWCFRDDFEEIPQLDPEMVGNLLKAPPQLCSNLRECNSRYVCEEGCRCIRERFNGATQFNEYQLLLKLYVKIRVLEIIFSGVPYNKV